MTNRRAVWCERLANLLSSGYVLEQYEAHQVIHSSTIMSKSMRSGTFYVDLVHDRSNPYLTCLKIAMKATFSSLCGIDHGWLTPCSCRSAGTLQGYRVSEPL